MNNLLIIIVIYKKQISELSIISNISNQKRHSVFIYDNSPFPQTIPKRSGVNIYYVHNKNNPGVSKGYNAGITKAKRLGKKYVLLLDQDTGFYLGDISHYIQLEKKYGKEYIYAPIVGKAEKIYSPFVDLHFVGKAQNKKRFKYQEIYPIQKRSLINSGLMIPLSIAKQIGGFNEKIKLDFSDIFFIEKYKELKHEVVLVNVWLEHSLSGDEGLDFHRELNRFKFYCNGAKELSKSLHKSTQWTVFRRMIRLIQKYKTLQPITTYIQYYIKNKTL